MANHLKFVARTVMVRNGDVDSAYKVLSRILTVDGIVEKAMRDRYYEKPNIQRRRIKFETCKRIYNSEMNRKIAFLSKKTREDPWPGC